MELNAIDDLMEELGPNEVIEGVVLGSLAAYSEDFTLIPENKQNVLLDWEEAKKYMTNWTFNGGYGSSCCPAAYIWTNKTIICVSEYDGSTRLSKIPRNPVDCKPRFL